MRPFPAAVALVCALAATSGWAEAQDNAFVEHKVDAGQKIEFRDDPLSALGGQPIGAQLTGFHPPKRYLLLRPRDTFVPELLKAVEHL